MTLDEVRQALQGCGAGWVEVRQRLDNGALLCVTAGRSGANGWAASVTLYRDGFVLRLPGGRRQALPDDYRWADAVETLARAAQKLARGGGPE